MRKVYSVLVAVCLVVLLAVPVLAQDNWATANQITIAWDAVPPVGSGEGIGYNIFTVPYGEPKENATQINSVPELALEYTITFGVEGKYILGVNAVRLLEDGSVHPDAPPSATAWSDDPAMVDPAGGTFGVQYFVPPGSPSGLRIR